MSTCMLMCDCQFYNDEIDNMPPIAGVLKRIYCGKDHFFCARVMLFNALGENRIPRDLMPHETDRIKDLL